MRARGFSVNQSSLCLETTRAGKTSHARENPRSPLLSSRRKEDIVVAQVAEGREPSCRDAVSSARNVTEQPLNDAFLASQRRREPLLIPILLSLVVAFASVIVAGMAYAAAFGPFRENDARGVWLLLAMVAGGSTTFFVFRKLSSTRGTGKGGETISSSNVMHGSSPKRGPVPPVLRLSEAKRRSIYAQFKAKQSETVRAELVKGVMKLHVAPGQNQHEVILRSLFEAEQSGTVSQLKKLCAAQSGPASQLQIICGWRKSRR